MIAEQTSGAYTQAAFDYGQLALDVRAEVQEHTRRLHELERRTGEGIIEIGQHLIAVKAAVGHGQFLDWVEIEFGWSQSTVSRFTQVAERFGKVPNLGNFASSALYALASGSIPEHVRDGFIAVAESGQRVTHADVQEALREERERTLIQVDADTGEIVEGYDEPDADEWVRPRPAPAPTPFVHVAQNSGENEWYTPPDYIAAAREVLLEIDLDPASSPLANQTVRATEFYTKDDNGLVRPWYGRVWLNPPYAQPLIQHFIERMVEHVASGDVAEAIVLVNNATDTRWFQLLAKHAAAVCFPRGRIRYLDKTGQPALTPLQGQALLYCGINRDVFERVFSRFGVVL